MTEYEKRMVYARMIEAMRQLDHIGGLTDDEEILNWTENTMKECISLMEEKLDRSNDFAMKTFRTLRLKKIGMTNADIAQETGLEESTVRVIVKDMRM